MKAEDVDDLAWIKSMMKQELDLRPPSLAQFGKIASLFVVIRENPLPI